MPVLDPQPIDIHVAGDVEHLAVRRLKAHAALAALVSTRVYTKLPKQMNYPAIRLNRIGGSVSIENHLEQARIQVEAYGTTKYEARLVAATAQAAIHAIYGAYNEGVVSAVVDGIALTWSPDPHTDRDRYLFDVFIYIHPNPN